MCGRLVNLDTVARVLAEYYHLKTDTQLAALDEALSRVPAETVGKELFGNSEQLESSHFADPGKMVGDLISRQAAIDAILHNQELYSNNFGNDPIDRYTIAIIDNDAQTIAQLPSAQQWIPTSERPPKVREWVLCQCRAGIMDVLRLTEDGSWNKNYPHAEYMSGFVIAWMPLPEPWKGGPDEH